MAKWELLNRQREAAVTAREQTAAVLLAKDAEMCALPGRGIRLRAEPFVVGYWLESGAVEIPLHIVVVNTWVHPARLRKLAGVATVAETTIEFPPYVQEHDIPSLPSGGQAITRRLVWAPTRRERDQYVIDPMRERVLDVRIEATGYLTNETGEFVAAMVDSTHLWIPRSSVEPPRRRPD